MIKYAFLGELLFCEGQNKWLSMSKPVNPVKRLLN